MKTKHKKLLSSIEKKIKNKLYEFVFEENNASTRKELTKTVNDLLSKELESERIDDFKTVCNKSNNTKNVVESNTGILDTTIEIDEEKYLNRITICKTGKI